MDENKNEEHVNEEQEHTNPWQAADNVGQLASNKEQAADNVKQTAANVEQSAGNVEQKAANVEQTAANVRQDAANVEQSAGNVEQKAANVEQTAANVRQRAANVEQRAANVEQTAANVEQNAVNKRQNVIYRQRRKINYVQTGVYLFLAFVVALAFYLNNENSKSDLKRLCVAGTDSRNVQRSLVNEIYKLNLSFIDPKKAYTEEEQKRIDVFLKNIDKFRNRMYAQIQPSEVCSPFVEDDNVKPPKIDAPVIKSKGVVNDG